MPRLKRYFPIPYLIVASAAIAHMVTHLIREPDAKRLAWLGALVAVVPLVSFMFSLALYKRPRTDRMLKPMLVLAVVGTAVSFIGFESPASWYALFLGFIPSFLYVFWYSNFDRPAVEALSVGARLPPLELRDVDGQAVTPTPGKHGLYMFVRGNWCPLCMAQVREIAAQYRELEARGVEVFLISRQPERQTRTLAGRFDAPIRFCVDPDGHLARELGIEHIGGVPFLMDAMGYDSDTVLPTVILAAPDRTILFADLTDNYRVRPEPATFLAALEAHG